jgi:hypothetical protein
MTKSLKRWSQKCVGSIRLQLVVAKEVVLKVEQAQDRRALSAPEQEMRSELKFKSLGLTSLTRVITCQRLHITFLSEGDANTQFFHLQACHRGRQNRIDLLRCNDSVLVDETQKDGAIFNHFDEILANYEARSIRLDFNSRQLPQQGLLGLDR